MGLVTLILGLSGSGKSHLARRIHAETGAAVFDELSSPETVGSFLACVRSGGECVAIEISLCMRHEQDKLRTWLCGIEGVRQKWICFENDVEAANWNVVNRPEKQDQVVGLLKLNARATKQYEYPANSETRPIFRVPERRRS